MEDIWSEQYNKKFSAAMDGSYAPNGSYPADNGLSMYYMNAHNPLDNLPAGRYNEKDLLYGNQNIFPPDFFKKAEDVTFKPPLLMAKLEPLPQQNELANNCYSNSNSITNPNSSSTSMPNANANTNSNSNPDSNTDSATNSNSNSNPNNTNSSSNSNSTTGKKRRNNQAEVDENSKEKKAFNILGEETEVPMRRNIRDVMDETQLDNNTLAAQLEESQRLARVAEQQKMIRENQRWMQMNRQFDLTQNRVLSMLQNGSCFGTISEDSSGKKPVESEASSSTCTPAIPIAKIEPEAVEIKAEVIKVADPPTAEASTKEAKADVVVIEDTSSDDDCILLSDNEEELDDDAEQDPNNSGQHVKDTYNVPDEQGRVLVNFGHPEDEEDIFVAPQIARTIKAHQIGGVRFLYDNIIESKKRFKPSGGFGCILAHSMGLGKTLQMVCFCDIFLRHTSSRKVLCVVPINTLQNWLAEFNRWLPKESHDYEQILPREFDIFVLGDQQKTLCARAKVVNQWTEQGGVLLMGYELFRLLAMKMLPKRGRRSLNASSSRVEADKNQMEKIYEALVKPGPDLVICDEGHRIKNAHASISLALKQIQTRRRIVLTGYPLQNNLVEYWCMVDFVRPNYLGTRPEFCNMFERPIQNGQCIDSTPDDIKLMRYRAHVLHSLLIGFVQRRSHTILTQTLPPKVEYVILTRMTEFQRLLYSTFMTAIQQSKSPPNPLKAFAVCCKIWNHPDVLYYFLKTRENDLDIEIEEGEIFSEVPTTDTVDKIKEIPKAQKETTAASTSVAASAPLPKQVPALVSAPSSTPAPVPVSVPTAPQLANDQYKPLRNDQRYTQNNQHHHSSITQPSALNPEGYFDQLRLNSESHYDPTRVHAQPHYVPPKMNPDPHYASSRMNSETNYNVPRMNSDGHFDHLRMNSEVHFNPARMNSELHFDASRMSADGRFDATRLTSEAHFHAPRMHPDVHYNATRMNTEAHFDPSRMSNQAHFDTTRLSTDSHFDPSKMHSEAISRKMCYDNANYFRSFNMDGSFNHHNHMNSYPMNNNWPEPNMSYFDYQPPPSNLGYSSQPDYVGIVYRQNCPQEVKECKSASSSSQIVDLDTNEIKTVQTEIDMNVNPTLKCESTQSSQPANTPEDETQPQPLEISAAATKSTSTKAASSLKKFSSSSANMTVSYEWALELMKDYNPDQISISPKMEIFFCILKESIMLNDRVLLFSQSLLTLNLIEKFLQSNQVPGTQTKWHRNRSYFRLDGSTGAQERERLVTEFNSNNDVKLFLISTRAGSLGINLVGANRVIMFDASWNPCHDTQAVYRIYRYGQLKSCFVYRIVMDNCLEKKIFDRQIKKQGMSDRIVDECNPDAQFFTKDITNLCAEYQSNEDDAAEPADFTTPIESYLDSIVRKVVKTYKTCLSKEPFLHESLLVDRKERKLSQAEKRLAQRGYEIEKKALGKAPFACGTYKHFTMAKPSNAGRNGVMRTTRWIPAEVWQKQGMTAQELVLPLDVTIPTSSVEKSNIFLKAGQRVMVLKSPKGIYMQLDSGKIIAIRTSRQEAANKLKTDEVIDITSDGDPVHEAKKSSQS